MYYDDEDEKEFTFLSKYQQEKKVNLEITSLLKEITRHLGKIADLRSLIEIQREYRLNCYDIESKEEHIESVARMASEQLEEGIEDFADTNAYLKKLRRDLDPEILSLDCNRRSQERELSELKKKLKKESYSEDDKQEVENEIDALFAILSANLEKVTKLRRLIYLINEKENLETLLLVYKHVPDEAKEALDNCQDKNEIKNLQLEYDKWKAFYEPLLEELTPRYDSIYGEYAQLKNTMYPHGGAI